MRVAIDASSVPPKPAGAGVYAIELVRALAALPIRRDGHAVFARGPWFDEMLAGRRDWRIERVGVRSPATRLVWEQARLPSHLHRLGIDLLHSTHHTLPWLRVDARRVVTVHDLTFFRIPQRYPPVRRFYMQITTRLATRVADAIIVPSQTIRDEVLKVLRVSERKLHVVYEAAGEQYAPVAADEAHAVAKRYGVEPGYVLSVGSLEPGKNRARLVRALRLLRDAGLDRHLLVIGQPAWGYEADRALVADLAMTDRVHFAGYVHAAHMPALYSAASAFAFPSLYEGFGLPVLEAMACGAPVLTSNISATAEVAGDAALLIDPRSVDAIADGLRALLTDDGVGGRLREAGLARAASFSWERAAAETHAVYARVAGKHA